LPGFKTNVNYKEYRSCADTVIVTISVLILFITLCAKFKLRLVFPTPPHVKILARLQLVVSAGIIFHQLQSTLVTARMSINTTSGSTNTSPMG